MSPELLDPERFGFKDSQPTKKLDCYALGMVVYEVLGGCAPFASLKDFIVMRKVTEGERPRKPDGPEKTWFEDDVWGMVNLCWETEPESRPNIETVLECLERVSRDWKPLPPQVYEGAEMDGENCDTVSDRVVVQSHLLCISVEDSALIVSLILHQNSLHRILNHI